MDWSKIEVTLFYFLTIHFGMAQLTHHQIHSIEDKIKEGLSNSKIAEYINKDRSVITRLFARYPKEAFDADTVIEDRFKTKSQATASHIRIEPWGELAMYIHERFMEDYSPEQIAGEWIKKQKESSWNSDKKRSQFSKNTRLSKDTVYDWIYSHYTPQELKEHMRRKNKQYRDRKKEAALGWKYQMGDQVRIEERGKKYPDTLKRDEVTGKRTEDIGHWEWDTIIWKDRSGAILTLVERKTGQVLIGELPLGKNAVWLTSVLTRLITHIPRDKIKSITFDNGREFADHKMIQYELKAQKNIEVDIYFAHPYHSWERWTNENTNWLIRQYLPKKTDFTNIKQKDLDKIQIRLNSRPRKRLDYATPDQEFWWNEKCCVSE